MEKEIENKIGKDHAERSCVYHMFTIQQLIEKEMTNNGPTQSVFIDLKKPSTLFPGKKCGKR